MADDALDRIGRLAAVARGLEREGGYNGAKLVRAAMERELIRHAEAAAPTAAEVLSALDAVADELAAAGYAAPFTRALRAASENARRTGGTITLDAAPRTRLCRVCGELYVGESVPAGCRTCDAPALSFREVLPVWYLEPAEADTVLAELSTGPRRVAAALGDRADDTLERRPAPGEWSARQTLEHLLFAEELLADRIPRMLEEDEPDLVARAVWTETAPTDEGSAATGLGASAVADRYRRLREATVARLGELDEAGWSRAGFHPEWGRVTVLTQAAYFVRHEAAHLAQLAAAADGRVPGPTRPS